eukprot:scaffold4157_cov136-Cylindrotheca_fusiformis.AAC.33
MTDGFSAANNPAMSRQEIEELLDAVPVFAVTESDKGGIVLVSEEEKENEIAYFFFNPEIANSVFAPLRKQKLGASWDVTQFSLGMVWFELFQSQEQDEIEYRLVPDSKELAAARQLLDPEGEDPALFQAAYNSIPVFVDQSLRVEGPDGEKKFPMYFSLQDLMESCQQAFSSTGYQAAVNVADFCNLLEQMQEESENDFRNVVFVPPTTMSMSESPPPRTRIGSETKDDEPISTPTATDNWDD